MKYYLLLTSLILTTGASGQVSNNMARPAMSMRNTVTKIYAVTIADTFSVFVHVPINYQPGGQKRYPIVYMLDANYYFNKMAEEIDRYVKAGKVPPFILAGIGYKDFSTMDSLRSRDYTYPTAIPEYEMSVSGGADKFLSFLNREVAPMVEAAYRIDTTRRILMGHSLGGYFTLYALEQFLTSQAQPFYSYIAASPSLDYNHYYLMNELNGLPPVPARMVKHKVYITYGAKENDDLDPGQKNLSETTKMLSQYFMGTAKNAVVYKSKIFPGLDHMAAAAPAFMDGLLWVLGK